MGDIYKIIEEYNPNKKRKISIVFNDKIFDIFNNKNLIVTCLILTKLSIGGRKVTISLVFIK